MTSYDVPDEIEVLSRRSRPARPPEQAGPSQCDEPRAPRGSGAAVPPDRRGRRGPGGRGDRQRPGLLGRRRLHLPRRTGQRRCAPARDLAHGRQIVTGMVACRVPIVAAVNGPAVGLGCSLVALSDIVFMAESAHLADPHVAVAWSRPTVGPVTWPLMISLQLAKEYALTGDRIPAKRAAEIGLVNHVCPDDEVLEQAMPAPTGSPGSPGAPSRTPNVCSTCTSSGPSWRPSTLPWARRTGPSSHRSCGPTSTVCSQRARREGRRPRSRAPSRSGLLGPVCVVSHLGFFQ